MKTTKKIYSYLRWSTDQQTWGDSERRQAQAAQDWCARRGLFLAGQEKDEGMSAWKGKNRRQGTGLDRLLKIVAPGDFLLVEDSDRLSRQDWLTAMNFLAEIVARGVTVVTLANGNEITEDKFRRDPGCFLQAILRAHLGNDENEKKSARVKASWDTRKQQVREGKAIKQKLPCWLRWDDKLDRPVVIEEKAAVVRRMFRLAMQGHGVLSITRQLTKSGTPTIGRNPTKGWYAAFVWLTITNKAVIGYCCHVEPPVREVYPTIVDQKTFYAVQAKLKERKHLTVPQRHSHNNLFTGLAYCSKCSGTMTRHDQRNGRKHYHYLVCSNAKQGATDCGMSSVTYDLIEKSFLALLTNGDLVRRALATKEIDQPSPMDSLTGQLADAENQAIKFLELIKDDPKPSPTLYKALKDTEATAADLRRQIDAERARVEAETPALESYEEFQERFAGRMQERQFRAEVKALLRSMVDKIVVDTADRSYEVHFRGASEPVIVGIVTKPLGWVFRDLHASPVHPMK